jgi:hypothetical protein
MRSKSLPSAPDFPAIDRAAKRGQDQRAAIMSLIGQLNLAWANNESLLIYVIMALLDTDEVSAAIVFATLNTTRARVDLVERLAKTHLRESATKADLADHLKLFLDGTKLRNDLNHCTFVFDQDGRITHTQSTKLQESKNRLQFGERRAFDEARIASIKASIDALNGLNVRLWDILPRLKERQS